MQKLDGSILVVDDNKSILAALEMLLVQVFKEVRLLSSPKTLISAFAEKNYDVVLLDMNFSANINTGNEGLYWLNKIKQLSPTTQVVLITAYGDIDLAVNAIKNGGFDFVVKPWNNAKLISTLKAAYELSISKKEVKQLKEIKNEIKSDGDMYWGETECMRKLYDLVKKVAPTDANILITGESGVGKDVMAREIHRLSKRSQESMVSVDIGSLTETLFESELFGHVKGAFTDAKTDRAGKFEVASGGTLFLDEIGNIPMILQSKLLTVIQNKQVMRVGSNKIIPIDIRLICATNKDLHKMVVDGTFREDLLYRINTIQVAIPPLRDRKEDIIPLSKIFLKKFSKKYDKNISSISKKASEKLINYNWSGNIRELLHTIEKAVILADTDTLQEKDFLLSSKDESLNKNNLKNKTIEEMEVLLIKDAIKQNEGNISLVAKQLGITRQTLYNKIKKYNL